ncbi:DUF1616 domain-containing protein [Haloterrigena alkaliphila]|uniref:DUF1616 domain-containing protein n=1 Tax=Haloterrigena alkaliphila TaxID=2816475 RepID=A0A8A2VH84_9EURY|nr:DUF1616 domain-containing protein [Haloterrigena alkaliphila]QSX00028.1 DUF1616 domain-containing protein [Haloterrigena alkaliphila]
MRTAGSDDQSRSDARRPIPVDLAGVVVLTIAVNVAVFAPILRETPLRIPLGLVLLLFLPGYAAIAAVFPERVDTTDESTSDTLSVVTLPASITPLERIVFSFGASIALVPLIGLLLDATPWGIRLVPMLLAVSVSTLAVTGLAIGRRWSVPEANRFRIPYGSWMAAMRAELRAFDRARDGLVLFVLVGAVIFASGSVAYAVAGPSQSGQYSSVTLATETGDGELVTEEYPTDLERGESGEVVLSIDNDEQETVTYTVVAVEQRVTSNGDEITVQEQRELERFEERVEHGQTWTRTHEFEPTMAGQDTRIVWLVYLDGSIPNEPSTANAAYHVQLTVDVTE